MEQQDATRDYHIKSRERQIPYDMTYTCNLKYDTDEPMRQKLTHIENRFVIAKGGEEWGREKLGAWGEEIQTITYRVDGQQHPTV